MSITSTQNIADRDIGRITTRTLIIKVTKEVAMGLIIIKEASMVVIRHTICTFKVVAEDRRVGSSTVNMEIKARIFHIKIANSIQTAKIHFKIS